MLSTANARERVEPDKLIAKLARIKELSEPDRQAVADKAAQMLDALHDEVKRLNEQVRWLAGRPYRPKRDKVPSGQLALDLIQMLTGKSSVTHHDDSDDTQPDTNANDANAGASAKTDDQRKRRKRRKRRGRDMRREVRDNRIAESERCCPACDDTQAELGFDTQLRFEYKPAEVYILEERNYKYACKRGCGGVQQAEATDPPKPIPGSMASSSMLANLVISKVLDGLPVERVAKRFRRHGVDLATSTLNDWVGHTAQMFTFLVTLLRQELLACSLVSLDDTPVPAKSRDHPKGILRGRQWIYLGDHDRVAYVEFTRDWKGIHPRTVLKGYKGDVQGDGYAGIDLLFIGEGAPRRVGCNDHCRRKFADALKQRDSRAQPVLDLYAALYRVEADAKKRKLNAAGTLALRRAQSVPIWDKMTETVAELDQCVRKKSPLGKAITYWHRQQRSLAAFLSDGYLPISNAHVERQIRTTALFRKASLFYGTPESGERHAVLFTILLNCVLAGANPYDYLVDVINKIAAGWPSSRAAELLPRNWLAARKREQQVDSHSSAAMN